MKADVSGWILVGKTRPELWAGSTAAWSPWKEPGAVAKAGEAGEPGGATADLLPAFHLHDSNKTSTLCAVYVMAILLTATCALQRTHRPGRMCWWGCTFWTRGMSPSVFQLVVQADCSSSPPRRVFQCHQDSHRDSLFKQLRSSRQTTAHFEAKHQGMLYQVCPAQTWPIVSADWLPVCED